MSNDVPCPVPRGRQHPCGVVRILRPPGLRRGRPAARTAPQDSAVKEVPAHQRASAMSAANAMSSVSPSLRSSSDQRPLGFPASHAASPARSRRLSSQLIIGRGRRRTCRTGGRRSSTLPRDAPPRPPRPVREASRLVGFAAASTRCHALRAGSRLQALWRAHDGQPGASPSVARGVHSRAHQRMPEVDPSAS